MALDHQHFQHDAQGEDHLPCGRHIVFSPLDGHSQKRLMPNDDGKFVDLQGAITFALSRAIKQVNGRSFDGKRMETEVLAMPEGSRLRAFSLVSGLTYGSSMQGQWVCLHCKADNTATVHVDEIPVTPYGPDLLTGKRTFAVRLRFASEPVEVRLRVMTGNLLMLFQGALARGECSGVDRALAQVAEVDGKAIAADKDLFKKLLDLPAALLTAIRTVVHASSARVFLSREHEDTWEASVRERLVSLGVVMLPKVVETPVDGTVAPAADEERSVEPPLRAQFPREGFARAHQLTCAACARVSWHDVDGMPDFFFRHLTAAVDV